MSLINDMLRDLEDRRGGNKDTSELVDGLSHVQESAGNQSGSRYLYIAILAVVLVLALILLTPALLESISPIIDSQDSVKLVAGKQQAPGTEDEAATASTKENEKAKDTAERKAPTEGNPALKLDAAINASLSAYREAQQQSAAADNPDAAKQDPVAIKSFRLQPSAAGATASIRLSAAADYRLYKLHEPERVVLEIMAGKASGLNLEALENSLVDKVRQGLHDGYTKMVLDMKQPVDITNKQLRSVDNNHVLTFDLHPQHQEQDTSSTAGNNIQPLPRVDARAVEAASKVPAVRDNKAMNNHSMDKQPSRASSRSRAEKVFTQGVRQYKQGQFKVSIASLERAIELNPENGQARYLLASTYIQQDRADAALSLLARSVELLPENTKIKQLYGQMLFQIGRQQQAIKVLRTRMPLIDEAPEYHALLAAIYQEMKKHQQSVEIYRTLVSLHPEQSVWWMGLGISLEALDRQPDALSAYEQAMQSGSLSSNLKKYVSQRIQSLSKEKRT